MDAPSPTTISLPGSLLADPRVSQMERLWLTLVAHSETRSGHRFFIGGTRRLHSFSQVPKKHIPTLLHRLEERGLITRGADLSEVMLGLVGIEVRL